MKLRKITQRDILYLSISMFIIVVVWIAFSIYHSYVTSTISEDLQIQIAPIDASFDMATIEKIKSRTNVAPLFTTNAQQATPSATPSLNQETSEEATPSGEELQITETITPTVTPSVTEEPTITP